MKELFIKLSQIGFSNKENRLIWKITRSVDKEVPEPRAQEVSQTEGKAPQPAPRRAKKKVREAKAEGKRAVDRGKIENKSVSDAAMAYAKLVIGKQSPALRREFCMKPFNNQNGYKIYVYATKEARIRYEKDYGTVEFPDPARFLQLKDLFPKAQHPVLVIKKAKGGKIYVKPRNGRYLNVLTNTPVKLAHGDKIAIPKNQAAKKEALDAADKLKAAKDKLEPLMPQHAKKVPGKNYYRVTLKTRKLRQTMRLSKLFGTKYVKIQIKNKYHKDRHGNEFHIAYRGDDGEYYFLKGKHERVKIDDGDFVIPLNQIDPEDRGSVGPRKLDFKRRVRRRRIDQRARRRRRRVEREARLEKLKKDKLYQSHKASIIVYLNKYYNKGAHREVRAKLAAEMALNPDKYNILTKSGQDEIGRFIKTARKKALLKYFIEDSDLLSGFHDKMVLIMSRKPNKYNPWTKKGVDEINKVIKQINNGEIRVEDLVVPKNPIKRKNEQVGKRMSNPRIAKFQSKLNNLADELGIRRMLFKNDHNADIDNAEKNLDQIKDAINGLTKDEKRHLPKIQLDLIDGRGYRTSFKDGVLKIPIDYDDNIWGYTSVNIRNTIKKAIAKYESQLNKYI